MQHFRRCDDYEVSSNYTVYVSRIRIFAIHATSPLASALKLARSRPPFILLRNNSVSRPSNHLNLAQINPSADTISPLFPYMLWDI